MSQLLLVLASLGLLAIGAWRTRRWLPFQSRQKHQVAYEKAPFAIERQTGTIHIKGSGVVFRRAMPKSEFLNSDLYRHTANAHYFPLENGTGHTFFLKWSDPAFENVHVRLNFEDNRLGRVAFGWYRRIATAHATAREGVEWTNEWIESEVERYRAFMVQQLGPITSFPHAFQWGLVYAARDDKAGAPAMGIRYSGFEFRAKAGPEPETMPAGGHVRKLLTEVPMQTRRAQHVDAALAAVIRQACSRSATIAACYLLDSRRKDNGKPALLIALVLDDEKLFESASQAFFEALCPFPPPPEVWIISAQMLVDVGKYRGTEFYVRDLLSSQGNS